MNAGAQADTRHAPLPTLLDPSMNVPVMQGEAEAPVAPKQRGPGRAENTGSRAPTRADLEQFKVWSVNTCSELCLAASRACC